MALNPGAPLWFNLHKSLSYLQGKSNLAHAVAESVTYTYTYIRAFVSVLDMQGVFVSDGISDVV